MRVDSALGARAAVESISSLTPAPPSSVPRGSSAANSVYGRLKIVTRTVCFSGVPSIRFSAGLAVLPGAQLVNLSQQFFDARPNLFALRLQRLQIVGEAGRLRPGPGGLFECVFFL